MKLLLLNTCGPEGSIALAETELPQPIVEAATMPGRRASEVLVATIRGAMSRAAWSMTELDAIAVVTGPGSFTGVRVGLSAAKGLCEASGAPMIALSRLELLAAEAHSGQSRVCALLDAGRGEFYCGQFLGNVALGEGLLSREEALDTARLAKTVVVCEESVQKALGDEILCRMVPEPTAADAFPFARRRLEDSAFDDPAQVDANYLRRTDAEIFAKPTSPRAG